MTRCKCYGIEQAKRIWDNAGINTEQAQQTFSNYKEWNESSKNAKDIAIKYYQNFSEIKDLKQNSICFIGQVGSGKTHLSIALAVNFLKKSIAVVYMPYREVITKLKQNITDEKYYQKQLDKYKNARVLLVDDLFKGKITESDINIIFEIINYRYLNQSPIIVTSEHNSKELLDIDEGIGSRLLQMCKNYMVEIEGKENNYRLKESLNG